MERKRRQIGRESQEEFENRIFPWMCAVALFLMIIYVAVSIIVNPWLFVLIPVGIVGIAFVLMMILGMGAALSSFVGTCREFMRE